MSTSSDVDGGDLEHTLRKHSYRKQWLRDAEAFLSSTQDAIKAHTGDFRYGDHASFTFDIPRSLWEPQLKSQIDETRRQLAELDRISREYIEAALAIR